MLHLTVSNVLAINMPIVKSLKFNYLIIYICLTICRLFKITVSARSGPEPTTIKIGTNKLKLPKLGKLLLTI